MYERTRERLAEELGVDPGAPLRALHQRILQGRAPTVPRAAPPPAPPSPSAAGPA
ncbi:BTAD domain-containing putative transcriptional regulator, partial [Streptomyces sp. B1866]|uniref:BTAD domain-containing putative transcriptional regulator n=1 Tax=Streptomyces sp. B1866 TaxID=3075431 RepID=UPI0034D97690